jgi:peptidoglycan/LPS O-acetylase OafA/YrhL
VTPHINRYFPWLESHLLIMFWPVLLLMAVAAAPLFYGTRHSKLDQLLGELSYPMYVSHILVSSLLARYAPQIQVGNLLYVASVIVGSLIEYANAPLIVTRCALYGGKCPLRLVSLELPSLCVSP